MNQKALDLQDRTRKFASDVIAFCGKVHVTSAVRQLVEQLVDSAGATDSNYRAACRARSPKEFIAKIGVAAEEADESKGWLQLMMEAHIVGGTECVDLINEADELTRIFVSSGKTAKRNKAQRDALTKRQSRNHPINNP